MWRCPRAQKKKSFLSLLKNFSAQSHEITHHPTLLRWFGTPARSHHPSQSPTSQMLLWLKWSKCPVTGSNILWKPSQKTGGCYGSNYCPLEWDATFTFVCNVSVSLYLILKLGSTGNIYLCMFILLLRQCFLAFVPMQHIWIKLNGRREKQENEKQRDGEREADESEQRATTHRSRQHTLSHSAESQQKHKRYKCHLG